MSSDFGVVLGLQLAYLQFCSCSCSYVGQVVDHRFRHSVQLLLDLVHGAFRLVDLRLELLDVHFPSYQILLVLLPSFGAAAYLRRLRWSTSGSG